jgi:hypothetical protein
MTMQDDDKIDAMVRAASAYPFDESGLTQDVLTRIRDTDPGLLGLFGPHLRGAALAFASVLVATPIIVTQMPGATEEAMIASLVLGEGLLEDADIDALLGREAVE